MSQVQYHFDEPDFSTDSMLLNASNPDITMPLSMAVAKGRLFILNASGEYEQVEVYSYWHHGRILSVCSAGYEYDEDGEIVRDWRNR
jgi:hypothetical protein